MLKLNLQQFGGRGSGSGGGGGLLGKEGNVGRVSNIRDMISERGSRQTETDDVLSVARRMNGLYGESGQINQFQIANMSGGGNVNQTIQQRADDWETMGRVDMGTNINPVVREMNDMIANVRNGFADGEKRVSYSFERNGQLIRYLNGYQSNTGDYDGMHISQTLDLHSVSMTKRSFANFLTYLDKGRFNGYADFARSELENQKKNNRRGRKR